jgi:MoxR-like ATPase
VIVQRLFNRATEPSVVEGRSAKGGEKLIREFRATFAQIEQVPRVIVGHAEILADSRCIFAGGHVLIEGVPGLAKRDRRSLGEAST